MVADPGNDTTVHTSRLMEASDASARCGHGVLGEDATHGISFHASVRAGSKSIPVMFSLPLREVEPGRYECQVTVIDPETQKASFWRMPLVIIP